jgi:hypothetical protein
MVFFYFCQDQVLWHQHLANPSEIFLTKLMSNLDTKIITCDSCHLSKFTRLPFMFFFSRANEMFKLVHSNVWGLLLNHLMVLSIFLLSLMISLVLLNYIF